MIRPYVVKTARTAFGLLAVACYCVSSARSQDLRTRIDRYMTARLSDNQSSIVLIVSREDEVIVRGEYSQSKAGHHSSKKPTLAKLPVRSIAEQFVSVAVLQLEERGKIRLDASICSYLPSCSEHWRKVQVLNLLTHTSGLALLNETSLKQNNSPPVPESLNGLLAALGDKPLEFIPGSAFRDSGVDFEILQFLLESISGKPWEEYIDAEVFRPLNMRDTKYFLPGHPVNCLHKSRWHNWEGSPISDYPYRAGSGCSTVEDLYRWNRAITKKQIISSSSLARMLTPYRDGHALGAKIVKEFDRRVALQSDKNGEISVSVRLYPDDETFIILSSSGGNLDSTLLTHDIGALLFGRDYPASNVSLSVGK